MYLCIYQTHLFLDAVLQEKTIYPEPCRLRVLAGHNCTEKRFQGAAKTKTVRSIRMEKMHPAVELTFGPFLESLTHTATFLWGSSLGVIVML